MKKFVTVLLAVCLLTAALAGCASSAKTDDKTIVVGASSTPHAEILAQVKDALAKDGWTLEVKVFDDYVLPNKALNDGELDANYFQHTPYLESFNAANGTELVSAAKIHYEPFGIYANGLSSLSELADGATIIIPADDSNETRALLLLQQEGRGHHRRHQRQLRASGRAPLRRRAGTGERRRRRGADLRQHHCLPQGR